MSLAAEQPDFQHMAESGAETGLLRFLVRRTPRQSVMAVFEHCVFEPTAGLAEIKAALFEDAEPRFPTYDEDTAFDINEGIRLCLLGADQQELPPESRCAHCVACVLILHHYARSEENDPFRSTILAMLVEHVVRIGGAAPYEAFRFVGWLLANDKDLKAPSWYRLALVPLAGAITARRAREALIAVKDMKGYVSASLLKRLGEVRFFDGIETDPHDGDYWRGAWETVFGGEQGPEALLEQLRAELYS